MNDWSLSFASTLRYSALKGQALGVEPHKARPAGKDWRSDAPTTCQFKLGWIGS